MKSLTHWKSIHDFNRLKTMDVVVETGMWVFRSLKRMRQDLNGSAYAFALKHEIARFLMATLLFQNCGQNV